MSVGIGFDSGQDLHFLSDAIANQSKVMRQSIEIDLGPRWTARDFLLCTGHRWFCFFSSPGVHAWVTSKECELVLASFSQEAFFQPKAPERPVIDSVFLSPDVNTWARENGKHDCTH